MNKCQDNHVEHLRKEAHFNHDLSLIIVALIGFLIFTYSAVQHSNKRTFLTPIKIPSITQVHYMGNKSSELPLQLVSFVVLVKTKKYVPNGP